MSNLGGKRPGAGRKPGGRNLRTLAAAELLVEARSKFPDYNPVSALIALGKAAEDTGDVETARQCHAAVLPYYAPKFRPVEADPDRLVELEERLAEVRSRHSAKALRDTFGLTDLAERLKRAMARAHSVESHPAPTVIDAVPRPPVPEPSGDPDPTPPPQRHDTRSTPAPSEAAGDWTPLARYGPEPQEFVSCDYENSPDGFLADYRPILPRSS